jgi:crossover junction endodeoxyribonuclease RusA
MILPLPPSGNNLFKNIPGKGRVKTDAYRAWRKEAALIVMASRERVVGPYEMEMVVGRPDKRRRDLSNTIKAAEDALKEGGAIVDDSLCERLEITWEPEIVPGGSLNITVRPA